MKSKLIVVLLLYPILLFSQTTFTTVPAYPTQTDAITITFDITHQTKTLVGYSGDVYAHTGVTLESSNGTIQQWQNVIGTWKDNSKQPKLTRIGTDQYQITIDNPRVYYSVTDNLKTITQLCFVLRSSDGSKQTEDIFIPLYEAGLSIVINNPVVTNSFGDPQRSPVFVSAGETLDISASTAEVGTKTASMKLYVNDIQKTGTNTSTIDYKFVANENPEGMNIIKIVAADEAGTIDSSVFAIMRNPQINNAPLPAGNLPGINYSNDPSQVTLALYAPRKSFVYVLGDFNDWQVNTSYLMNKYEPKPDSVIWWITIPNLESGKEYSFQYLIDGQIRVADPYADKILDPWNDSGIPSSVYPNLKPYPDGKTENIVGIFQTGQPEYNWRVQKFNRPTKDKLIIYELLVRDFVSTHSYKTITDTLSYFKKLGINAIELMPINEFEGNSSWGYNPMMYFAPDKYYGTKNDLKTFIDACHEYGIAVIMDIVLNHAYGLNPMVRMYWDSANNRPAADNPWFNQVSPNPVYNWGYDFNHESKDTKYFVDRVTSYWLTQYKFDGFRFDFTKGFTNTPGDGSSYDASRIAILERIDDKIRQVDPTAYVILENFAPDTEEKELTDYGMMVWGNLNYNYSQATMGWIANSNFGRISYKLRGFTQPGVVGYMESHDEQRVMYQNLTNGNSYQDYNIKNLSTALDRMKLAACFFFTVPGPKMIWQFGEVGYDISIDAGGRLSEKPLHWEYYSNAERKALFNVFAGLIRLKKNYPAFSSSDFSLNVNGTSKSIHLNSSSMNVTILGNFGVTSSNINPAFQSTGTWYEFFTGDSINVTDVNAQISLQHGEYKLYTSSKLPSLDYITDVEKSPVVPSEYKLEQNYPNPLNPSTTISFTIPNIETTRRVVFTTLKVYDILGREITTLVNEEKVPGSYNVYFNGNNLPSGIYFYRLAAGNYTTTKKMLLLK